VRFGHLYIEKMNAAERDKLAGVEYYQALSFQREFIDCGGLQTFNIHYGFLEGLLRGFRAGFLTETNYRTLCQVSKLDEFKVALVDTDYNGVLDDASGDTKLTPTGIVNKCQDKWVDEFLHVRTQATGAMKTFMDYIRYEYMIDNITLLLRCIAQNNPVSEISSKLHPLGIFPNINSVLTFDADDSEGGLLRLFETVLVDTPIGFLFERHFVSQEKLSEDKGEISSVVLNLEDKIDILNVNVKRLWLQDFYAFTQRLGGETAVQMKTLLDFHADARAIRIMVNSFGRNLNEAYERDARQNLFAAFGELYHEGIYNFRKVSTLEELGAVLQKYERLRKIYDEAGRAEKDIEDCILEEQVKLCEFAFWGQNHLASIYSFVKLKEQEIRNLFWIADCILSQRDERDFDKWVAILSKE